MESSVGRVDADFGLVNNGCTFEHEDGSTAEPKLSHESNLRLHETGYVNVNDSNSGGCNAEQSDKKADVPVASNDSNATSWSDTDDDLNNMDAITKDTAEYMTMKESLSLSDMQYQNTTQIIGDKGDTSNAKDECGEYVRKQESGLCTSDAETEGDCQKVAIVWTTNTPTDIDVCSIDEYIDMKIQRLSPGRTQSQELVKKLKQDVLTDGGSQKVALSWGTNTHLDFDACSIDEYIDMKIQRLSSGDTQSQDAEKILKSTIKAGIKSSLMKNKQLYDFIKVPHCEIELESFITDIADVCLRASKEKDIIKRSRENDINAVDIGNVENGDGTATKSRIESPDHVLETNFARSRIVGRAPLPIMQNAGEETTKTIANNKSSESEDRVYDYAYATRQNRNTKSRQGNQSHVESTKKRNTSTSRNESLQKNQGDVVDVKRRLHGSTTSQATDGSKDDIDINNSYSNNERVISQKEAIELNATEEAIRESQSIENETTKQGSSIETRNIELNKLLQWAVESGHRRINKSAYNAADDKIYINSYDEIDSLPTAVTNQNSGFSFSNSMKLKSSIICLVIAFLAFTIFLTILIVKL